METTPREHADKALRVLAGRLDGILTARLAPVLKGLEWTALLRELDRLKGKEPGHYSRSDVQPQLRVITERIGQLGYPLDDHRRTVSTLGSELRIVRNHVAHMDEMDLIDAWRAADFVVRLLEHFEDTDGAAQALDLRDNIMRLTAKGPAAEEIVPLDVPVDDEAAEGQGETEADDEAMARDEASDRPTDAAAPLLGGQRMEYDPWSLVKLGDVEVLDHLRSPRNSQQVRAAIQEIVEHEGPVHEDRVAKLVARAFGLKRVEAKRMSAIKRQIAKTEQVTTDQNGFLWQEGMDPQTWREFRPYRGGAFRDFARISPNELANAARVLRAKHPEEGQDALGRRVMQTFGVNKRTKKVATQLSLCWLTLGTDG